MTKKMTRKRFCKLRLTDTGRSKEQERTDGLGRILDTCFGTDNGIRHLRYRFILTDDSLMQFVIQMQRLIPLTFCQLCNRNTCPPGNNPGDFFIGYRFVNQGKVFLLYFFFFLLQLFFQIRQFAIGKLCSFLQVAFALCNLNFIVDRFDLFS